MPEDGTPGRRAERSGIFLALGRAAGAERGGLDIAGPERLHQPRAQLACVQLAGAGRGQNPSVPLLERVRFLSISASNLDEFYSVARRRPARADPRGRAHTGSADGLSPAEQLQRIDADARALMMRQQECWRDARAG